MTQFVFLEMPEKTEMTACISAAVTHEKGPFLVFDRTLFYPQGGGQPADVGVVMIESQWPSYHRCTDYRGGGLAFCR